MGRSGKYSSVVLPNLEKIRIERINGASMDDIADMLNIAASTLYAWAKKHPEFGEVLSDATHQMHANIESTANHSLLEKLKDRMLVTEQIIKDGVIVQEKRKLILADTTAITFALKSRNPEKWDQLGVARIDEANQVEDVGKQIADRLEKYMIFDE